MLLSDGLEMVNECARSLVVSGGRPFVLAAVRGGRFSGALGEWLAMVA